MKMKTWIGTTAAIGGLSAAGASVLGVLAGCSAGGAEMVSAAAPAVGRAPAYLLVVQPIALRPMGADDGAREANPFADGGFDDMPPGWVGGGDLRPRGAGGDPFWKAIDAMKFDVDAILAEDGQDGMHRSKSSSTTFYSSAMAW